MRSVVLFAIIIILLSSFVSAEGEYPSYIIDAETAMSDAWAALDAAVENGIDVSDAEATLIKVEGLLDQAKVEYDAGDEYNAEEIALTIFNIAHETIDLVADVDIEEPEYTSCDFGRKFRLLQLERSIYYNYEMGKEVNNVIKEIYGEDNKELEEVYQELFDLFNNVKDFDTTSDSFSKDFVMLRKEYSLLARKYKAVALTYLSDDSVKKLRGLKKEKKKDAMEQYKDKILEAREKIKICRIERVIKKFDIDASEIMEKLHNGDIKSQEVIPLIKQKIKEQRKGKMAQDSKKIRNR